MAETLFHPAPAKPRARPLAALLHRLVRWQAAHEDRVRLDLLTPEARRDMGLPPAPAPRPERPVDW